MSNTKYFADLIKVCSVLPVFAVMPAMAAEYNEATEITISENTAISQGAAWQDVTGSAKYSALYFVKGADVSVASGTNFSNNKVGSGVFYTSVNAPSSLTLNPGVTFENNVARFDGGAIANFNTMTADGVTFRNNSASLNYEDDDYPPVGGGAIALGAESQTVIKDSLFDKNTSRYHGGAIAMRGPDAADNSGADLDIINSEFIGNKADMNGGAIYSAFYSSEAIEDSIYIYDTDFSLNSANNGGAIYTEMVADLVGGKSSMKIVDADFVGNTAAVSGGAIWNGGNLILEDVDFENNWVAGSDGGALYITGGGTTDISGGKFYRNHADADTGGAIVLKNGTLNINGTHFIENTALYSGAIFTYSSQPNTLNITNALFEGNVALSAGAAQTMNVTSISDTVFRNNVALVDDANKDNPYAKDGGGALFVGSVGKVVLDNVTFENNSSDYVGGAVATRQANMGNNKDARLDVLNSHFIVNKAGTTGGAFDNYLYSSVANDTAVYFENVDFSGNSAVMGGAIYNHGAEDLGGNTASTHINGATFTGNVATDMGGALYNEADGAIMLSGDNTFTGNTANGIANDIYNDGTLTIAADTTTIDGGITGNGMLDIKSGATLDVGSAIVEQSVINVEGTLKTYALNAQSGINIFGDVTGSGTLQMNVGTAGTYDMSSFADLKLEYVGTVFDVTKNGTDMVFFAKSTEKLAVETGMSVETAGAVSALVASTDAQLQQISLIAQDALAAGDVAVVEKELAKVNPETKPLMQSVSSSVQNQVLAVASGRMASVGGASTGRAGGDVTAAGIWAQGLFNKSKLNGQFHGYTRGLALGADTVIDDVYTIGAGYAYNNTDVHADGRDTGVESNSVFVYGQYKPAEWFVNTTLSYTTSEYKDDANVFGVALDNEYDADAFGMQTMFGYDFASGVTPIAGLRYLHISQDEHRDALGRTIEEMNSNFLSAVAGVDYAFEIENDWAIALRPELHAAMTYDVISDSDVATIVVPGSAAYYVDVENLSRMGGEFGIGLTAEWRGLEVSLNYELDLHKDYTSQTGLLKFRYNF